MTNGESKVLNHSTIVYSLSGKELSLHCRLVWVKAKALGGAAGFLVVSSLPRRTATSYEGVASWREKLKLRSPFEGMLC